MGALNCKVFSSEASQKKNMEPPDDYVEDIVCQDSDIKENEMKTFDIQDAGKVLLVRQKGKLSAIGTKCTHYGAPLVNGALGDGRVRCQWHGACFNILNGDIEDFPGLDSLPCYQVTVENNNVKVRARRSELESNKRLKVMVKRDQREGTSTVVIGGGPAGACCVETLRQEGFAGQITLVAKEDALPYDRVKVSKSLDFEIEKAQFRTPEFYKEHGIDVLKNTSATGVDAEKKTVALSNGSSIRYDRLFIATGSKARKTDIPGADLKDVCVLRDFDHSMYVQSQLAPDKHVVVLGASFIALEAAAYCVNKVERVTVIGRDTVPFRYLLGEQIGERVMRMFQEKGVHFIMKNNITRCIDEDGKLKSVELSDGSTLKADLCIMGVGSTLYTEFLNGSGVNVNPDGSITVDQYLETNVKGVYAGGDIANAPVYVSDDELGVIGHYPLAHYHGKIAALNMIGKPTPLKAVPYFWTVLFGKSFRYAGHGKYDDIKIVGDLEELKYVAFYLKGDKVIAASSCQRDPVVSQYAEFRAQGKQLYRSDLEADPFAWTQKL